MYPTILSSFVCSNLSSKKSTWSSSNQWYLIVLKTTWDMASSNIPLQTYSHLTLQPIFSHSNLLQLTCVATRVEDVNLVSAFPKLPKHSLIFTVKHFLSYIWMTVRYCTYQEFTLSTAHHNGFVLQLTNRLSWFFRIAVFITILDFLCLPFFSDGVKRKPLDWKTCNLPVCTQVMIKNTAFI